MKKHFTKTIAWILVAAAMLAMMPFVYAGSVSKPEADTFSYTVGKGTLFKEIGLPETIYADGEPIAVLTWNPGSYDSEKEGTYTLSGTAKMTDGSAAAVTAYVTVKDCGFRLPHMAELIAGRTTTRRNGFHQSESFLKIGLTPLFDTNCLEDYTWNYRWYKTTSPGVAGKLYSTEKDCPIDMFTQNQYYYCKLTGTKDGVSTTLTSRCVYVTLQPNDELMCYKITTGVDEIVPGEDFKLTATAALRFRNGAFDQFYYSGVDDYIPHFTFSCDTPGVTFSEKEVIAPRGVANVTVHTTEEIAQVDEINISVHVKTVGTSKIYYKDLVIDNTASASVRVLADPQNVTLTDVHSEWYADSVRYMLRNGYMGRRSKDTFGANEPITRGELINILYRIDGFKDVTDLKNVYDDVKGEDDFVNAVLWARNNEIMNGTGEFTFSPQKKLTRQEFATILFRYFGEPNLTAYNFTQFSDHGQVADYAVAAMHWAINVGILKGSAGKLNPTGICTRAMAAAVFARYLDR